MAVQAGLISAEDIIIDAKSGVSGAGRSAKQNLLYTEIAEGINCYGVGSHRHMPEIEQARHWLPNFWTIIPRSHASNHDSLVHLWLSCPNEVPRCGSTGCAPVRFNSVQ